jgi:LVIVD repeat
MARVRTVSVVLGFVVCMVLGGCDPGSLRDVILGVAGVKSQVLTGGIAKSVAVNSDGTRVYLRNHEGFQHIGYASDDLVHIYDVSDLSNPRETGTIGPLGGMEIQLVSFKHRTNQKDYLLVLSRWGDPDLRIFDLTDPDNPVHLVGADLDLFSPGGSAGGVVDAKIVNDVIYAVGDGLAIVDVGTDPNAPEVTGTVEISGGDGAFRRICLLGGYAYVADSGNGLLIFDVTNPAVAPVLVATDDQFASVEDVETTTFYGAGEPDHLMVHGELSTSWLMNPETPTSLVPGPPSRLGRFFSDPSPQLTFAVGAAVMTGTSANPGAKFSYDTTAKQIGFDGRELISAGPEFSLQREGTTNISAIWQFVTYSYDSVTFFAAAHGTEGLVLFGYE